MNCCPVMSNLIGSPQNSRRAWGCLSTPSTIDGLAPGLHSPTRKPTPTPKSQCWRDVLRWCRLLAVILGVAGWAAGAQTVEARAPQQPSCAEQGSAGDWLEQAQDANRSYEQRKTAYEHALGLCPRAPALYANLSALLLEHQDIPSGLSWARRGLQVAPGDPDLSLDLGVGLLAAGQPEEALPVLAKLAPTARNQFYLGMANRALRDYRAAQQSFSQALAMGYPDPYLLYVLIEQSFGTWLPTFNREILMLPNAMSVQMASILAGATALGRISAGVVLRRVPWYVLLNICVLAMGLLVVLTLPLASSVVARPGVGWFSAPIAAYVIPLIGLLMAPIYPVINSVALSSLPKSLHAAMTGLIVVFSALGGTLGSRITAIVFSRFDGIRAFYFSLVPMTLLLIALFLFRRETERAAFANGV